MGDQRGSASNESAWPVGQRPQGSVLREADAVRDEIGALVVDPPTPCDEEVLLLLHDIDANALAWGPLVRRLLGDGRLALVPDLRGRGSSFGLGPSPDGRIDHGRDLGSLLERFGVDRVIAVGHGWGSEVARRLAEDLPEMVCAIVAIDPSIWRMGPERFSADIVDRDALRRFWRSALEPSGCLGDDAVALADHDAEGVGPEVVLRVDLDVVRRDASAEGSPDVEGGSVWRGPVEIVRSAHDLADGRAVSPSHDVPLLDHNGVVMSPNGVDAVLAAIGRADRAVARAR